MYVPVELLGLSDLAAFKCALFQACHFQDLKSGSVNLTKIAFFCDLKFKMPAFSCSVLLHK